VAHLSKSVVAYRSRLRTALVIVCNKPRSLDFVVWSPAGSSSYLILSLC